MPPRRSATLSRSHASMSAPRTNSFRPANGPNVMVTARPKKPWSESSSMWRRAGSPSRTKCEGASTCVPVCSPRTSWFISAGSPMERHGIWKYFGCVGDDGMPGSSLRVRSIIRAPWSASTSVCTGAMSADPDVARLGTRGDDRDEQDRAVEDRLHPERRTQQVQAIEADGEQDDRDDRPGDVVVAGPVGGDTEEGGRIGRQQQVGPEAGVGRTALPEREDRPDADQQPGRPERGQLDQTGADAGQEGDPLRPTDGVEPPSERRVLEHVEQDEGEHERQPDRRSDAQERSLAEVRQRLRDAREEDLSSAEAKRHAAEDDADTEGGDERTDLEIDGEYAVDEPDEKPACEHREDHDAGIAAVLGE